MDSLFFFLLLLLIYLDFFLILLLFGFVGNHDRVSYGPPVQYKLPAPG